MVPENGNCTVYVFPACINNTYINTVFTVGKLMNLKSGLAVAVAFILAMQVASFPAFLLPINTAAAQGVILGINPIAVNYDLNSFGRTVILAVQYQTGITTLETCSSVNPENVLLTLTLPEHTSFVSETNGAGIFDPATRTVTWSLGTLDAATNCFGTQISITINVDNAVLDGTILGPATAAISTTTLSDDPIDNTRSVTFQGGMLPLEVFYTEIELRCTASGASDRETADGTAVDCSANAPGFLQSRVSSHADASPSITPQKLGELRVGGSPITTPKVGVTAHAEGDFNCDFTVLPPDPLPCLGISQSAEADVVNMLFEVKNPNPFAVPLHVHSDRFGYAACSDNNSGFPGSAFIEDSIQSAECSSSTGTVSPGNGETSSSTLHADLDSATGVCDIDRIDVINGERTETHSPTTCNPIAANTQGLVKGLNIIFDSGDANGNSNVIFSGSGLTIIKSGYGTYNAMAQSTIGLGGQQFSFPALMKITANSPVQLLLTDQEGRSVGVEPVVDPDLGSQGDAQVAQRIVANIPGSQYTGPVSEPQEISIGLPNPGTYNLDVRGTGSGQFTITVETFDENGNIISHNTKTGQASPGSLTREELTVQTGGTPPAPPGSFNDPSNNGAITLCPVGTFTDTAGQSSCTPAPAGSFVGTTGATSATLCPAGSYQPNSGQTSCVLADPGFFVSSTGATQQTQCPQGTTSDVPGSTTCHVITPA
ncbi:MAG TPA: hypothetical protein VK667_01145, partial [Ktedonobacteraceae bacterium]|nr:hypothetical protein [Ktedonobacteraceae bacterium]